MLQLPIFTMSPSSIVGSKTHALVTKIQTICGIGLYQVYVDLSNTYKFLWQ